MLRRPSSSSLDSTSQAASAARNTFSSAMAVFQTAINEASLAGKRAEVEFWENKCSPDSQLEKLALVVNQVWQDRRSSFKVSTIVYNNQGQPQLGSWEYSSYQDRKLCYQDDSHSIETTPEAAFPEG